MDYLHNAICPVCGKPLAADDDVVVCPDCGAPYHRACYQQLGQCKFADRHDGKFVYHPAPLPRQNENAAPAAAEIDADGKVVCPFCRTANDPSAEYCSSCGAPLEFIRFEEEVEHADKERREDEQPANARQPAPGVPIYRRERGDAQTTRAAAGNSAYYAMEDQMDMSEQLDGYSLREWLDYIGPSGPYYLLQFKRMDMLQRSISFSWTAALFAPLYFLYRKMWNWGILALVINIICYIPTYLTAASEMGISLPFTVSAKLLSSLSVYGEILLVGTSILWALFAFTLYRKKCLRDMSAVKARGLEGEAYSVALRAKGGVSIVPMALFGLLLLASYLVTAFFA